MRLALGTVQFGLPYGVANQMGQVSFNDVAAILKFAKMSGMDTLDTAMTYGESEWRLGEIGVQDWRIISKLPGVPEGCQDVAAWVQELVNGSLERLKIQKLYGLLLHRPQQLFGSKGDALYGALVGLKKQGYIEKIGVSVYGPDELDRLWSRYQFDLVQAPFNVIDRRLATSGWLQRLKDNGVEIHTRSAFLQGLLLMPQDSVPKKFSPWGDLWNKWYNWLSYRNASAVQACLAFSLSFPEIDRVIVGVDNVSQLEQIFSAVTSVAPPDDLPDLHCDDPDLINPSHWSSF